MTHLLYYVDEGKEGGIKTRDGHAPTANIRAHMRKYGQYADMRIDAHRKILTHGHWPYLIKTLSLSILILGVHCGFAALDINEKVITGIDGKNKVKSYGKKVERKTCRPMISFCE